MHTTEEWVEFFGDDFFRNGKNSQSDILRRITAFDKIRDSDIHAIGTRLTKLREIYNLGILDFDTSLLPEDDVQISHFGYTCDILAESCRMLKAHNYDANSSEIKQYLEDKEYQKFVDALLSKFILYAKNHNADTAGPISEKEKQEHAEDMVQTKQELLGMVGKLGDAKYTAEEAEKILDDAKKIADNILPNVLTTLGIFVAIIIAVVACYLSLLLSQHFEDARPLNITICLLMGQILTNVICLLFYLISKMTSFTLCCNCPIGDKKDCGQCSPEKRRTCTWENKIWLKYPYVVILNGVFCLAYVGLGLWNIGRKYLGRKIDEHLLQNPLLVFALMLLIILMFFIFTRTLAAHLRWKDCGNKAKRTTVQRIRTLLSATAESIFRGFRGLLRCLTAPVRRMWTDLVRLIDKGIDARHKNEEVGREIKELKSRIEELERKIPTEAEKD